MKLINRSAFAIFPRQPFADWANQQQDELNQPMSLAEHRAEGNVYLTAEFQSEDDVQQQLAAHYQHIFENELAAWDEFADHWPKERSLALFQEWFEVVPQVMALDLLQTPLLLAPLED
ncbi:hypothetical protein [Amphritea balenae]|uniref:VacJ n=1 Tax=Amphritea balenae TaxID=452629 RepID=A0A3P1SK17_9GAMM|nr:hypothetical protein [Amphritea balenae]RRC96662.1 hypothetical protein EHS89_20870 [Amphritea balenae]GGK74719.1 hypothetical protein GCM10007941_25980 [Amphritea balenae]